MLGQPLAHLGPAAELVHEVGVQPRLVDPQLRVGQQPVAVEALDVVALERRPVAPDVDAVLVHGPHQHGAGHRPAERGGVEVGAAAGADVEGAAGERGQPLLDQLRPAVDARGRSRRRTRRARAGYAGDVGLVVLPDVGGVGARDRALVAHPGDRDGGVEAAGERDADPLALGQGGEDLAHGGVRSGVGVVGGHGQEAAREGVPAGRVAADDQHGVVAGDGAEHVAAARPCRRPRRGTARRRAGCAARPGWRWPRPRPAARRRAGPAGPGRRRSPPAPRVAGRRPRRARRRPARRRRPGS